METIRVPRAPKLRYTKELFLSLNTDYTLKKIVYINAQKILNSNKHNYIEEYLRLITLFNLIVNKKEHVILTAKGREFMSKFDKDPDLSENDKEHFLELFKNLDIIQKFCRNVFYYDIYLEKFSEQIRNQMYDIDKGISSKDIYLKYFKYRQTKSKKNSDREARYIFNWLQQIDLLYHDKFVGKFYITSRMINYKLFENEIIKIYESIKNKKTGWVEIPLLRYYFCSNLNVKPLIFNRFLIEYINNNRLKIMLEKGTASRTDVKNEGLMMEKSIYFYIKWRD